MSSSNLKGGEYIHKRFALCIAGIGGSRGRIDGRGALLPLRDRTTPPEVRPLRRVHRQVEEEGLGAPETVPGPQPGICG